MADDGESLESWFNKATSPSNRQEDWESIMGFCDRVNKELEGPQISVKLLVHKIHSPQEWEVLQALTVLETCMKNCGKRFHNEVGKFRFLNELIKVISPKYLGDKVSEKVKTKVITMMYSWTVSLPHEAKICGAYQMLKSQGVVLVDPEIPFDTTLIPSPSPQPKNSVFDDEKKSKKLAKLLKSKKPEDLQEANRLIKNMVKEDDVRKQKATKQKNTLEAVNNSVKVLNEMLTHFSPEDSADGDKELIRELHGDCEKLRQTVSQLATETEDNDSSLGDILQASDDLTHVINSYKKIVEERTVSGETESAQQTRSSARQGRDCTNQSEVLIDLEDLDIQSVSVPQQQPLASSASIPADLLWGSAATDPQSLCHSTTSVAFSLLDEELISLGLNEPIPVTNKTTNVNMNNHLPSSQESSQELAVFDITPSSVPACSPSSLFPDLLSLASVSLTKTSSTTSSALNFPGPRISTESVSTASVTFPQPFTSVQSTTFSAALPQSFSLALPAHSANAVPRPQVFTSLGASHATSTFSGHNQQDFAFLDLGCPNNLLVKSEDLLTLATLSSSHGVAFAPSASLLLSDMQGGSTSPLDQSQADDNPLLHFLSPILPLSQTSPDRGQDGSLANIFVPLDAIKPSQVCPVTAYDKNGIRVLLHFATDCPTGRPDILVMVASMLNTAALPVRDVVLQAAVPKMMKLRLQQPSGTELAPFNPILPPASITQVMLLANPLKEKVRMRYKLTFTLGEQSCTEVGEVNEFPPADTWGTL